MCVEGGGAKTPSNCTSNDINIYRILLSLTEKATLYGGTHLWLRFKMKAILLFWSKLHIILKGRHFNEYTVNYLRIVYKFADLLMCKCQIKI